MKNAETAMSIIPSTFDARQINHTSLGGSEKPEKVLMPVTCIVINRAINQYRSRIFKNLESCGFQKIVSVERFSQNRNTVQLSHEFPAIKFLCSQDEVTECELVNLGMNEVDTRYVLVVYDDVCLEEFRFTPQLAKKLVAFGIFCVCPRVMTSERQNLPVRFTPCAEKTSFLVDSSLNIVDRAQTLYPFDMLGFYDADTFKQLGGFDYTIKAPYWQRLDLFFRAWLWGEKILLSSAFNLSYFGDVPADDSTTDFSYLQFYLKNLIPVFKNDHGEILKSSFFSFKARSSCGFNEALALFSRAAKWVKLNAYRFKTDSVSLMEHWGQDKGESEQ